MSAASNAAPDCAGRNGAHTQGPWVPEWELSKGAFCQVAAFSGDGNRVMRAAIESFRPVEDARLIAAAPELLAVLRALMPANVARLPATTPDSATLSISVTAGELRKAMAAIAKAEAKP